LYLYYVSQSSEFCRHNPLCCFSTSNTKGKRIFGYRLGLETFRYVLVRSFYAFSATDSHQWHFVVMVLWISEAAFCTG